MTVRYSDSSLALHHGEAAGPSSRKCGTYAGYQQHYKDGGKPCGPCTHAHSVYHGQWRARTGRTKAARVPYEVLGALLKAAPTELEEWAEQVLGDAVVTRAVEAARKNTARPLGQPDLFGGAA